MVFFKKDHILQINDMEDLNIKIEMDGKLAACMKGNPMHHLSRFEAFMQLISAIKAKKSIEGEETDSLTVSYSTLARWWHWAKPTVSLFIGELCRLKVISKRKAGNSFVFTINPTFKDKIQVNPQS